MWTARTLGEIERAKARSLERGAIETRDRNEDHRRLHHLKRLVGTEQRERVGHGRVVAVDPVQQCHEHGQDHEDHPRAERELRHGHDDQDRPRDQRAEPVDRDRDAPSGVPQAGATAARARSVRA